MELEVLSYQAVIDSVVQIITYAAPIAVIFAMAEKALNLFLSMAFGSRNIRV